MNLYRMTYVREGKPRSTTFVGKNAEWAHGFAQSWCDTLGVQLLTVILLRPVAQAELELVG
jgi:hypothetical protein